MEKTLTIDGRQVRLKSTGAFLLRYKMQFGRDAIQDAFRLIGSIDSNNRITDLGALDLEVLYNMIWTLAKTADASLPPPMEWLDTFAAFPLDEVMPEVIDMIASSFISTAASKKK